MEIQGLNDDLFDRDGLDDRETMRNRLQRVRALLRKWDEDDNQYLATWGQHTPASLAACADMLRDALADEEL